VVNFYQDCLNKYDPFLVYVANFSKMLKEKIRGKIKKRVCG